MNITILQRDKMSTGMDHLCQAFRDEYKNTTPVNPILEIEVESVYHFTNMPDVRIRMTADFKPKEEGKTV